MRNVQPVIVQVLLPPVSLWLVVAIAVVRGVDRVVARVALAGRSSGEHDLLSATQH